MSAKSYPATSLPSLQAPLGLYCLQHLSAVQLASLRQVSRAMRDLVDGHTHEAWAGAAADLLPPSVKPTGCWSGAEWQSAIRREWQSQQHLRSGTIQQVVKVGGAYPTFGMWAKTSKHGPCCSYFLSPQKNRFMRLLNADARGTESMLLGSRLWDIWYAFVRKDSLLCIVEAFHHLAGLAELRWRTIDPASGQTLSCTHRHFWLPVGPLDVMFHAASHKVAALGDEHSVIVMDADTLQEVSKIRLCSRHQDQGEVAVSAGSLAWSHDGSKLAVTLGGCAQDRFAFWDEEEYRSASSEVHVFDAASGQCVQSISLRSPTPKLTWSSSQDMLLVHCEYERSPQAAADQAEGAHQRPATVRILEPAQQRAVRFQRKLNAGDRTVLEECHWSPCGTFLLTSRHYLRGGLCYCWEWCVQDPATLDCVFKTPGTSSRMSWASRPSSNEEGQVLTAFLTASRTLVTFSQCGGHWQAAQLQLKAMAWCIDGRLAPSADLLVAIGKATHEPGRSAHTRLIHYSSGAQQEHVIVDSFKPTYTDNVIPMAWAPFPAAWPQMYAYVHRSFACGLDGVDLVDAQAHRAVGSWTSIDLKKQALGRSQRRAPEADILQDVSWSPSGRHLAVPCRDEWTLVLSF